ncbi:MAG: hypothetical protein V2J51_17620 [Erythrobacter sp.]|nr:hypothetical protein [Erythrobacter sp.]
MSSDPSLLSLVAAGFYIAVAFATVAAAFRARRSGQASAHAIVWIALAFLFVVLAVSRMLGLEDLLEQHLREGLRGRGSYDDRGGMQSVLVATLIAATGIGSFAFLLFARGRSLLRGRRNLAVLIAGSAGMALILLVALRVLSFHQTDALLYGPLKLNWIIDLGASVTVIAAALFYVRLLPSAR